MHIDVFLLKIIVADVRNYLGINPRGKGFKTQLLSFHLFSFQHQ